MTIFDEIQAWCIFSLLLLITRSKCELTALAVVFSSVGISAFMGETRWETFKKPLAEPTIIEEYYVGLGS